MICLDFEIFFAQNCPIYIRIFLIYSLNKIQQENTELVEQVEFPPDYFKEDLAFIKNSFLMNLTYAGMDTSNSAVKDSVNKVIEAYEDENKSLENGNYESRAVEYSNLCERELTYLLHEHV